jgi:hypothetical protein
MHDEPRDTPDVDGDTSDVVTGPVGSAHLVEPTKAEALGADLGALPKVDVDETPGPEEPPTNR